MLLGKIEVEALEGGRLRQKDGLIMPWYTWPCLEWLSGLDLKDKWVWEYGVGDSTAWFQEKGAITNGVDDDFDWAVKYDAECFHDVAHYCGCIALDRYVVQPKFHIVIIDGVFRDQCTSWALAGLKPGGYLIIDNYHQPSVEPNIWTETDRLIKGMPITIYKQPGHSDWQTAVITNP